MTSFKISHLLTPQMIGLKNTDSPRHEFYVHQALADELCHPLCDELRKYWKVFDGETVARFAQYLYQADCDYPEPIPTGATTPTSADCGDPNHAPESPGGIGDAAANAPGDAEPPVEAKQAALLTHAKLYILSYSQGINALSDMCISRLRRELGNISSPPADKRILEGVVELLRYAYCSPRDAVPPKPLQPAWAELQDLVSQLCAPNIDVMEGNQEFTALVQEGGALATDILASTIRRLKSAEAALTESKEATLAAKASLTEANEAALAAGAKEAASAAETAPENLSTNRRAAASRFSSKPNR